MSSQADIRAQDALDALTAGIQARESRVGESHHDDAEIAGAEGFIATIEALHEALTPVEPPRGFARRLRADLLGEQQGMVERLRQMPARVHIAAALAVVAGCLLVVMRRIFGSDAPPDIQDEAVAAPL